MRRRDRVIITNATGRVTGIRGMTLLEVMIAMVILAVGLLGISGMQVAAIRGNSSGFKSTIAVSLADDRIAQLEDLGSTAVGFADLQLSIGTHDAGSIPAEDALIVGNMQYDRSYTVTAYQPSTDPANPIAGLRMVTYTVSWNENNRPHSATLTTWIGDPNF